MMMILKATKWLFAASALFLSFAWASSAQAAIVTWDGGAADTNWNSCSNWSTNVCPTSSDVATFDATSTKDTVMNATINVSGIDINTGYTGTITQGTGIAVTISAGNYDQADGVFTGSNAAMTIGGSFTLSSGTFTATTGTTTVTGAWTHTVGGTFNHNSGTMAFTGFNSTIDVATTETFGSLTVNKNAGAIWTVSSGDTIVVTGTLTFTQGNFATGTIEARGNISAVSGWTHTGVLKVNGTTDQTFAASANPFSSIIVDKASGLLNIPSTFSVGTSTGTFTLTNGTVNTQNFAFSVANFAQSGGTFNGGSSTLVFGSTFAQSGGIFNAGTGTGTYSGAFTLSGGTHTASTGTVSFSSTGAWTHTAGGTFNHNSGTMAFTGFNSTIDVATTETFGSLIVNKNAGGIWTVSSGDTIVVTGTLTLTQGNFATGTLEAQGDVAVTSLFNTGGSGLLKFSGSAVQTVTLTGVSDINNGDITINKSGGQVNLSGNMVLNATSQDFIIEEGTFDLNGSNLTVNGTSGTLVVQDGGNLQLQGGETITANASNPQILTGSTVTYDGTSASYTMKDYTYHHLAVAGGATSIFAPAANESLGGNLTITSGILDQATRTLAVTGTFSNSGTLRRRQGEAFTATMDTDSGTVEYAGDGDGSAESVTITDFGVTDYYNLVINDQNATKDLFSISAGLNVAGTLTVTNSSFAQGAQSMNAANVLVNGGTFTGGSSAITLTGTLTLSSGTMTSTSDVLAVGGNVTLSASFDPNGGTMTFTGNDASIDIATGYETFSSLIVNKTDGQTLTIALGDVLTVASTLTYTNGAVGTGTMEAQGNVTVASGFDGGSGVLKFGGSSAQSFDLTGATGTFDGNIEVAKTSGTATLASALVMNAAGQDLTITSGTLTTSGTNYALTVAGDVTVNGGTLSFNGSTVDLNGSLVVAGGTLNMDTATIALAGDATYTSGSMAQGTSAVTLDGASQQFFGGTYWYDLTKSVTAAATLTLPSGTTTTVLNTLTLGGAADQLLSLRSSTDGVQHLLAATLPGTYTYLDIKDSYAVTAQRCLTTTSRCVNANGNTGWTFRTAGGAVDPNAPTTVGGAQAARAPVVTISAPNGGETYSSGNNVNITWSSSQGVGFVHILWSSDGGTSWNTVVNAYPGNNVYTWTIPEDSASAETLIKVQATDLATITAEDMSNSVFTITSESTTDDEQEDGESSAIAEIAERITLLPESASIHGLVKLADDGDLATQADSALYYIGADGKRHAFPNEQVYRTWFCNFDSVQIISEADLAIIPLGANVTYRPGVRMVKFLSVPKVYAVDALGTLRWIATEAVAANLYGSNWNTHIDDISDAFYGNYVFGDAIIDTASYSATEAAADVAYPSDSFTIPGYSSTASSQGLSCE